jgi:RHS repeat-associated protein
MRRATSRESDAIQAGGESAPTNRHLSLLHFYGYRFYDPLTGRWPSRDPIAERGRLNPYGFVGNDGVTEEDVFGFYIDVEGHDQVDPPAPNGPGTAKSPFEAAKAAGE